ncbi:MAG: [acyl-carrier-protein] S-malonyltransferase [Nitrospira bacterium HGW-Nitrospira-1]|nr:MAG: [acyl-carrier-protein] S-malonyltransferase [Nitrospira bacterium HGW-Nitrospira-1]
MKIAFVFPGQGSQYVGMGKDLCENFDEVHRLYEEASETLGYDVKELSFNGPQEELNKTFRTQPCILTAGIAAYKALSSHGITAHVMAGHSLGEYSAIVAAGVISFKEAALLTEKRGMFMQEAVPEGQGLMAAIIGLDRQKVDDICRSVETGYVSPANYNSPGQIVIAGEKQAVEDAMKLAKNAGAKRALALAVSVPSHCALMAKASNRLAELLNTIEIKDPEVPIMNNADAVFLTTAERIKASLIRQLNSPLLWEDSVKNMVETGIDAFIEVGPGKTLTGLIRRIEPSVKLYNVEDSASLNRTLGELKG